MIDKSLPQPPRGLKSDSRAWWRRLVEEYGICDSAGLILLQTALEARDRMRECQKAIKAEGAAIRDRFNQVKPHPLLPAERDARAAMLTALRQLNLDVEPLHDRPGRP